MYQKKGITKEGIEAALAVLQVHHDLHGAPCKHVTVQHDGSLQCDGHAVSESTVRLWARAGYSVMVVTRVGDPARFPEFEQVKLTHPGEAE